MLSQVKVIDTQPGPQVSEWTRKQQELARKKAKERFAQRRAAEKAKKAEPNTTSTMEPESSGTSGSSSTLANKKTAAIREQPSAVGSAKGSTSQQIPRSPKNGDDKVLLRKPSFRLGASVIVGTAATGGRGNRSDQPGYIVKVNPDHTFNVKLNARKETLYNVAESDLQPKSTTAASKPGARSDATTPLGKPPTPRAESSSVRGVGVNAGPSGKPQAPSNKISVTKNQAPNGARESGVKKTLAKKVAERELGRAMKAAKSVDTSGDNSSRLQAVAKSPAAQRRLSQGKQSKAAAAALAEAAAALRRKQQNKKAECEWKVGDKVLANFRNQGQLFPGVISRVDPHAKVVAVDYDDGDKEVTCS